MTAAAGSPDGGIVVGGGASGTLYIWSASSGRLLTTQRAHNKVCTQQRSTTGFARIEWWAKLAMDCMQRKGGGHLAGRLRNSSSMTPVAMTCT
jgi:WD40 repeat protein